MFRERFGLQSVAHSLPVHYFSFVISVARAALWDGL